MLRNEVLDMMVKLKLRGMHAVFDEVLANGRKARWATEKYIMELLCIYTKVEERLTSSIG